MDRPLHTATRNMSELRPFPVMNKSRRISHQFYTEAFHIMIILFLRKHITKINKPFQVHFTIPKILIFTSISDPIHLWLTNYSNHTISQTHLIPHQPHHQHSHGSSSLVRHRFWWTFVSVWFFVELWPPPTLLPQTGKKHLRISGSHSVPKQGGDRPGKRCLFLGCTLED